jgi:hypothetical protein
MTRKELETVVQEVAAVIFSTPDRYGDNLNKVLNTRLQEYVDKKVAEREAMWEGIFARRVVLKPPFDEVLPGGAGDIHRFRTHGIKLKKPYLHITYDIPKEWSQEKVDAFIEEIQNIFNHE